MVKTDFTFSDTIAGYVTSYDAATGVFGVRTSDGREFRCLLTDSAYAKVCQNLGEDWWDCTGNLDQLLVPGQFLHVYGIFYPNEAETSFEVKSMILPGAEAGTYRFEEPDWWVRQIGSICDSFLGWQFGYPQQEIDYTKYSTRLHLNGAKQADTMQETDPISRRIFGMASAYLLTGEDRYLEAAEKGTRYLHDHLREDDRARGFVYWYHGLRRTENGEQKVLGSEFGDDYGAIPAYEQIYAIAGPTQTYRITGDPQIRYDIDKTLALFEACYKDPEGGGYFSHLDPATFDPRSPALEERNNRAKKNWNSVGDHAPAYLINLYLATGEQGHLDFLLDTADTICAHFPDYDNSPFVQEKFHEDWSHDSTWGWQQDRAVIGHNLKIAWNLIRCANWFLCEAKRLERTKADDPTIQAEIADLRLRAETCTDKAVALADKMAELGVDQIRGGVFDAMERHPKNGMPMDFAWMNTKDFWQQEQGILAYLILHGRMRHCPAYQDERRFLELARETAAFWNLFFLDLDRRGVYFRVTDNGLPVIEGDHANKAGHAIAGYHAFELNYLAHIYTRAYVGPETGTDDSFCLYFRPSVNCGQRSINVLPDFFAPGDVHISAVTVNGIPRAPGSFDPEHFQLQLAEEDLGATVVVTFCTCPASAADEPRRADRSTADAEELSQRRCGGL